MIRDGLGPLATFFVVWKLVGLAAGIAAATGFAVLMYRHERRRGRPGMIVRLALGLVLLRALVGLIAGSATVYLGQEVIIDAALGSAFLASLTIRRPLAELFGREVYLFPEQVRDSYTYSHTFWVISAAWGAYFILRGTVRLIALLTLSVDQYVIVLVVSDVPFLLSLLAWSVLYTVRTFRTSEEWGAVIARSGAAD